MIEHFLLLFVKAFHVQPKWREDLTLCPPIASSAIEVSVNARHVSNLLNRAYSGVEKKHAG